MEHTFGQAEIEGIFDFFNLLTLGHTLQLVPEFSELDVKVHFVLSTWELGTASTGRGHQVQRLEKCELTVMFVFTKIHEFKYD